MKRIPFAVALTGIALMSSSGCGGFAVPTRDVETSSNEGASTRKGAMKVTEEDFVSLSYDAWGGYAGPKSQLLLKRESMSFHATRRPEISANWSKSERAAFYKILNDANFPALVGNYEEGSTDAYYNNVVLVLRRGKGTEAFTVNSYGKVAPKPFYQVTAWLKTWQEKKFPAPAESAAQPKK
jgi:hypothetical protein